MKILLTGTVGFIAMHTSLPNRDGLNDTSRIPSAITIL
jgi:hypothetical protein